MNCRECQAMIRAYENGEAGHAAVQRIAEHANACPPCRAAFESARKVAEAVEDAFRASTTPAAAREAVLAGLGESPTRVGRQWFRGRAAMSAAAVIVIALAIGVATAHRAWERPLEIEIGELHGTVLQKHRGAQVWEEVTTQKKLYLGDELQALPGSAVVLRLRGNSVLRLEAAGRLRVTEYNGEAEFGLTHGTLRATLASPHPPFAVSTPQGLIRALGTDFEVSVE